MTDDVQAAILAVPKTAWTPAYDSDQMVRPGAWVAELTGMLDLAGWPNGMRVIVRKERPHPGAQLRFTGIGGHRFTCFATGTSGGQLADLELRHRLRARCEDRIRAAKDTGLRNLPLHGYAANQIWTELVAMACELLAWMQMLALDGQARRWEPKRLRLRLFTAAGRITRGGRRLRLRLATHWPWPPASPPRSAACKPWNRADPAEPVPTSRKETPGPVEPRSPGATAGPPATASH
jgi:DDE family transposase